MLDSSQNLQNTAFFATCYHICDHQIYEGYGFNSFDIFPNAFDCFLSNLFALDPNANKQIYCKWVRVLWISVEISHH
jgi:hypothetical protein